VKQKEITKLKERIAELETLLADEKAIIAKLETDMKNQKEQTEAMMASTSLHRKQRSSGALSPKKMAAVHEVDPSSVTSLQMPNMPSNYVSPEVVAKHKHKLSKLEKELRAERMHRREADGEIIKLRAAINGVQLNDAEVNDLLAQKLQETPSAKESLRYVSTKYRARLCGSIYLSFVRMMF